MNNWGSSMITINGIERPNFLMNRKDILNSLKIGEKYLSYLESKGLPYIQADDIHLYDPIAAWKWYMDYRREKK